jgi:mRNA interferase RelE/StbE
MKYRIEYLDVVRQKHIPDLPSKAAKLIQSAIAERLSVDPVHFGKPLRYTLKGYRRLRVSDYRIVYRLIGNVVRIVAIKHRKDIYDE